MALIRWNTHTPSFNHWLENFFGGDLAESREQAFTTPAVNIRENDEKFVIEVSAPGLQKEDFKLDLEHEVLSISAERKSEQETKTERYTRREFSYNSFRRSFTLPKSIDLESIKANYENGILLIDLPKRSEAKTQPTRTIEIG